MYITNKPFLRCLCTIQLSSQYFMYTVGVLTVCRCIMHMCILTYLCSNVSSAAIYLCPVVATSTPSCQIACLS